MPLHFLAIVTLAFTFILGVFNGSVLAQASFSGGLDDSKVAWYALSFKSKNFFGTAISNVELKGFDSSNTETLLIAPPQGTALKPSGPRIFTLTLNTTIDPRFGSTEASKTKTWFSSENAEALQRIRVKRGKEQWQKTYRWMKKGVYRLRKKPHDSDEENLPEERWKDTEESIYPYALNSTGCLFVSEPSLLLYIASATNLSPGDQPLSLCIFNKKQLHHVRITAERTQQIKVNYLEKSSLNKTQKSDASDVLKLSIKTRPLFEPPEEAEQFSFMKLNGDFDIYLDKATRVPVLIKGKTSKFGNIDIKLQEVGLLSKTD